MGKGARLARRSVPVRKRVQEPSVGPRQWAVASIAVVLLAVVGMVAVRVIGGPPGAGSAGQPSGMASTTLIQALSQLPAATFDTVGVGKVDALPKHVTGQPPLTDGGKPLIVYIGAEYCPFCAAQRWPLVVALWRFGTFTGLGITRSASEDVYANTATLSFHGMTYTSQWLAFQGVETNTNVRQGNGYAPMDKLTDAQTRLLSTYSTGGAIPFLDLGNAYVITGASFSPQLLEGMTADEIGAALADPKSNVTQAVLGTANLFTAVLCQLTGNQPANVCTSPAVTSYQDKLHG